MKGFAVVIAVAAALGTASAQSLRAQIDASNKVVTKFLMAKDVKGFGNYMKGRVTPGFTYVEAGQTSNFQQMVAGMESGLGMMKKMIKAEAHTVKLREKGNTATATSYHEMTGTITGPDKKPHTMSYSGTSEDTYVRQGGKWKMSKMAWIKDTMLVDGKPVSPGAPAGKGK